MIWDGITNQRICALYILILCLRWSHLARTKVDTFIEFPLDGLDMSPYLLRNLSTTRYSNNNTCLYDLAAVVVHHGNGMGSGK